MNPFSFNSCPSFHGRIAIIFISIFILAYFIDLAFEFSGLTSIHGILGNQQDLSLIQLKLNVTLRELSQCETNSITLLSNKTNVLDQMNQDLTYETDELSKVKEVVQKLKDEQAIIAKAKEEMEKKSMELNMAEKEVNTRKMLLSLLSMKNEKERVLQKHKKEEALLMQGKLFMEDYIDRASSDWPIPIPYRKKEMILNPPEDGYCHSKHLFAPIPYSWFCHSHENVFLYDSEGTQQNLTYLGQFSQSKREHVFHYEIKNPGSYVIKSGTGEISKFFVNPEKCFCPEPFNSFKKKFQCSKEMESPINDHFGKWTPNSIKENLFKKKIMFCSSFLQLIQVSIINNTVYWRYLNKRKEDQRSSFLSSSLKFIQSLLRKVKVPDCEFFLNEFFGNPQIFIHFAPLVLSPNTQVLSMDVPIPDSFFWSWMENGDFLKISTKTKPWEEKISKLFSRIYPLGNFHEKGIHQNNIIRLSKEAQKRQNMTDVKIVSQPWTNLPNATLEYLNKQNLSITHWAIDRDEDGKYKFGIVNLPEYIYPDLLLGIMNGKLMLKQRNLVQRWWFDIVLNHGVNHIEVGSHFHDLIQALDWIRENEEKAKRMAENAFHSIMQRLRPQDAYCWLALGLTEYSKALNFTPKVRPSMKKLDDEMPKETCDCVDPW